MPILPKINFTELNVPKDNFNEYPYDRKPIFRIRSAESISPDSVNSEKYLLENFVCEETGKTVKIRSDPEEPLNKLEFVKKMFTKL